MASTKEYVEFVADQMRNAGEITFRKMFGEYGIYCDGKIIGTVENDQLYLKITKEGQKVMPEAPVESPHEGSRMLRIDDVEDAARLSAMVRATYAALPQPKPKKAPKKKTGKAAEKEKGEAAANKKGQVTANQKDQTAVNTGRPEKASAADNAGEQHRQAAEKGKAGKDGDCKKTAGEDIALIRLTRENLQSEHICCALSQKEQVQSKKRWMADAMEQGLTFVKGDVRGKCFIEYLPAEAAWAPVEARGCMYIDCLWVAGQWKGKGFGDRLLKTCIDDSRSRGMRGIVAISSHKKRPFLSDPSYLKYRGFTVVDQAEPDFELLYLPLTEDGDRKKDISRKEADIRTAACGSEADGAENCKAGQLPRFLPQARVGRLPEAENEAGFVLYYTAQCPFTVKCVPLLEAAARAQGIPLAIRHIDSVEKAQACPAVWTTFALFFNGRYLTNELMTEDKFLKLARQKATELP